MQSVVGKKEGEGPYGEWFDCMEKDPKMGGDSWEEAEGKFQEKAAKLAIEHAGLQQKEIRYIVAGDLLGQLMASSFGLLSLQSVCELYSLLSLRNQPFFPISFCNSFSFHFHVSNSMAYISFFILQHFSIRITHKNPLFTGHS